MLIRIALLLALVFALPASAQQGPPSPPEVVIWRQLYMEAVERLVATGAQANGLITENAQLKAEIAKLKSAAEPPKK